MSDTYGLAACVWRRLRARHGGAGYIPLIDRAGAFVAYAYLWRYEAKVSIPNGVPFAIVSWKRTIDALAYNPDKHLPPARIPIGVSRIG